MKKHMLSVVVMCWVIGVLGSPMAAQPCCEGVATVDVVVAPSTLNLNSMSNCVTVHAEIPLAAVDTDTVKLWFDGTDVAPYLVKADNRGELVAKFDDDIVKALLSGENGSVVLTLDGNSIDGGSFSGSDTIRVINKTGK